MGVLRVLDLVIRLRAGDLRDGPPVVSVVVDVEIFSVARRDDLRQLPDAVRVRIVLLRLIDGMDMLRDAVHVLHELVRLLEDIRVDPLDDRPRFRKNCTVDGEIRVVDVAFHHGFA